MRVPVEVENADLEDGDRTVPGVVVTCTRCEHEAESFGRSKRSVRRCAMVLKEECPMGEENYYAIDADDLDDRED